MFEANGQPNHPIFILPNKNGHFYFVLYSAFDVIVTRFTTTFREKDKGTAANSHAAPTTDTIAKIITTSQSRKQQYNTTDDGLLFVNHNLNLTFREKRQRMLQHQQRPRAPITREYGTMPTKENTSQSKPTTNDTTIKSGTNN